MYEQPEFPWELQNLVPYAAQGVYADFQPQGQLLLPYYQEPLGGPNGARLIPINAIPAASGHVHNTTQPYAFCYSAGALLARMDGLQLNPRAKPFVLTPQERGKTGARSACVGQLGHSGAFGEDKGSAKPGRSSNHSGGHSTMGNGSGDLQVTSGGRGRVAGVRSMQPSRTRGQNSRRPVKQSVEAVRRTVYICDLDQQVTEEQLAAAFEDCGQVVDCRVCCDTNSAMRFAFIEFYHGDSVQKAIATMNGMMIGAYPVRVMPSKTAIVPVNNQYLPRNDEEREACGRTVYVANIDKKVDMQHVLAFFEKQCGPVSRIRVKGDHHHHTRIAFVEFLESRHAKEALACSGALLGSVPIRVSPSKCPVRDDPPFH